MSTNVNLNGNFVSVSQDFSLRKLNEIPKQKLSENIFQMCMHLKHSTETFLIKIFCQP